jgi:hypothetical protein
LYVVFVPSKFEDSRRCPVSVDDRAVDSPALDEGSRPSLASEADASVVFLISSKGHLGAASRILEELSACLGVSSKIVVTETFDPSDLVELIRVGADDFFTPPLKDYDILPRLWR